MPGERVLVTGGAGFIGSALVRELLESGFRVRVLDDLSSGRLANLEEVGQEIDLITEPPGIRSAVLCARAVEGVECVFHQAAIPSVPRSIDDPLASDRTNVGGTLELLEAARREGVGRFVYASSSSVYGDDPKQPKVEARVGLPLSPYAASKRAAELYAGVYSRVYGLDTVGLRYFNVFGPRQDPGSQYAAVVPRFITQLARGEAPTIHGDGEQARDFTYIDDAVHANLLAMDATNVEGEVFNVATGSSHTVNELFAQLRELTRSGVTEPIHGPPRTGDVRASLADLSWSRERLGFEPRVAFTEGLELTVRWFLDQSEPR